MLKKLVIMTSIMRITYMEDIFFVPHVYRGQD